MWKRQKERTNNSEDWPGLATPAKEEAASPSPLPERNQEVEYQSPPLSKAHIGKSLRIKGELRGSEDMHIDGKVEGSIELGDNLLTIGPAAEVKADMNARKVVIHGSVKGNIHAVDSVDVQKSGSLVGDLVVAGVSIAEGAYFKGSIDIQRAEDAKTAEDSKAKIGDTKRVVTPAPSRRPDGYDNSAASSAKSQI